RDVALWIGPAEDVGEPYVPEGIWRVGPVRAEPTVAQHEPHAVAKRQPERQVDLEIRLLDEGTADRARLQALEVAEGSAGGQELEEAAELVRRCDDVGGRHDAGEEARIPRQLDDAMEVHAERATEHGRERWQQRWAGEVAAGDAVDVLCGDTIVHPAHAQGATDRVPQHGADVRPGHAAHDLAQDEAARHGLVREAPPRSPGLWELREDLHDVVRLVEKSEVDDLERQIRNAGAVDQHV